MNAERLRHLLDYDPDTGIFTNRTWRGRASVGAKAGCLNALGYFRICLDYVDYAAHRLAWLHVHGVLPESQIDHINGDRADNRLSNLRLADNAENNRNRPLQKNNTSGFKGVSYDKRRKLWEAAVTKNGVKVTAGYHATAELAYEATIGLREELHGDFAKHAKREGEVL